MASGATDIAGTNFAITTGTVLSLVIALFTDVAAADWGLTITSVSSTASTVTAVAATVTAAILSIALRTSELHSQCLSADLGAIDSFISVFSLFERLELNEREAVSTATFTDDETLDLSVLFEDILEVLLLSF